MTLEKRKKKKQLQQEQQSSRTSGTVTFIATKRNCIFLYFFLVLLLIFFFLKFPQQAKSHFHRKIELKLIAISYTSAKQEDDWVTDSENTCGKK